MKIKKPEVKLTQEEEKLLAELMQQDEMKNAIYNAPQMPEKADLHHLLLKFLQIKDSKKNAYLDKEELHSVRKFREVAGYFELHGMDVVAEFLFEKSENILATSLSKKGFFVEKAITTRRDIRVGEGKKKEKTGWFKKNVESSGGGGE